MWPHPQDRTAGVAAPAAGDEPAPGFFGAGAAPGKLNPPDAPGPVKVTMIVLPVPPTLVAGPAAARPPPPAPPPRRTAARRTAAATPPPAAPPVDWLAAAAAMAPTTTVADTASMATTFMFRRMGWSAPPPESHGSPQRRGSHLADGYTSPAPVAAGRRSGGWTALRVSATGASSPAGGCITSVS